MNKAQENQMALAQKKKESQILTKDQKIDNTRHYYSLKMKTLLDEDGYVKPGKEKEYEELTDRLTRDLQLLHQGKDPSYLEETEQYEVGEVHQDAAGRKGEYLGNNRWKILPK